MPSIARVRIPCAFIIIFFAFVIAGCTHQPQSGLADATDCSLEDQRYAAGIGMNTTLLAVFQDELLWCMENNRTFDNDRALALLDSFVLAPDTGIIELDRSNPLRSNNLAIRSDLLRMLILQRKNASYAPEFGPVMGKLGQYGFASDGYMTWYEGSGYLVYTLAAVKEANLHFINPELLAFEESSERWLSDFALPDGTLAPIGDTALDAAYAGPETANGTAGPNRTADRIVHTDHETAVFFDEGKGYLLFRHPVKNAAPGISLRNDFHVPFDFGSAWLWYGGEWVLRPVGYPGYSLKGSAGLDDKFNYNIQSADRIGGDFTQKDFESLDILRYLGSWRAKNSVLVPEAAVQRKEYPDRYELSFSYSINTGEGGSHENYSRKVVLYRNRQRMEIIDSNPANASSYLMVSDAANITSASPVSCGYEGKWSPAWGRVEKSRRCSVGGGTVLNYAVEW